MASSAECMSVLRQQRNVVSKNSSPVSSAASVPVEKKTFLLWAATWETALAMFDPVLTARKSTLSLRTRSLARRVATSGFSSLSPVTSSILRPSTPPAALSRSAPNRKPATLASPMYATGPLRGSTIPILIGPVCDHPRRVVAKGPAAATPAAATPLRKRLRALPLALAKTREELIDALERPAAVARGGALDAHQQVLLHRDRREDPALLGHVADPEPRDPVRWQPHDALEGRGLPDTVTPQETDDLAGLHAEAHPVEDVGLAVVGVEFLNDQQHSTSSPDKPASPRRSPGSRPAIPSPARGRSRSR